MKKELERRISKLEQGQAQKADAPIVMISFVSPERPWDDDAVVVVTCGDYRLEREADETFDELTARAKNMGLGMVWYACVPQ